MRTLRLFLSAMFEELQNISELFCNKKSTTKIMILKLFSEGENEIWGNESRTEVASCCDSSSCEKSERDEIVK